MRRFLERIERIILRLAVLSLVAVVLTQGVIAVGSLRWTLRWSERLEDIPVGYVVQPAAYQGSREENITLWPPVMITFGISPFSALPQSRLLVNGVERARFSQPVVVVSVNPGDMVEVDSRYYRFPVTYTVDSGSSGLISPQPGRTYTAQQNVVILGRVVVQ